MENYYHHQHAIGWIEADSHSCPNSYLSVSVCSELFTTMLTRWSALIHTICFFNILAVVENEGWRRKCWRSCYLAALRICRRTRPRIIHHLDVSFSRHKYDRSVVSVYRGNFHQEKGTGRHIFWPRGSGHSCVGLLDLIDWPIWPLLHFVPMPWCFFLLHDTYSGLKCSILIQDSTNVCTTEFHRTMNDSRGF